MKFITERLPLTIVMHNKEIELSVLVRYSRPFNMVFDDMQPQKSQEVSIQSVTILTDVELEWLHDVTDLWYKLINRELYATYDFIERYENSMPDTEILD
jgi:hypothetical protein